MKYREFVGIQIIADIAEGVNIKHKLMSLSFNVRGATPQKIDRTGKGKWYSAFIIVSVHISIIQKCPVTSHLLRPLRSWRPLWSTWPSAGFSSPDPSYSLPPSPGGDIKINVWFSPQYLMLQSAETLSKHSGNQTFVPSSTGLFAPESKNSTDLRVYKRRIQSR